MTASKSERYRVYAMLCGAILSIKTLRTALNSVVPIMAYEMQLTAAQSGALLSAFFPGYLLTQMPAGPIVQRIGGKRMLSICLFGTAGCFLAAPFALVHGGIALTSALLGILGLMQGPMSPGIGQVNRDWIPPEGQERSIILRVQGLAHTGAPMLAAIVTPLLARGGWRRVFYAYGGVVGVFSVMWQLLVSGRRGGDTAAPSADQKQPTTAAKTDAKPVAKTTEWRIFTLPSVISLICWQVGSNFLFACLQILGPTFYMSTLNCTAERAGMFLALAQLVNFPATFFGAAMESLLLKRMSKIAMSKTLTLAASIGEAGFALLYGFSTTPVMATWFYAGIILTSQCQRAWSNFYEVGGKDVATLSSVANTIANVANLATPYLGVTLRKLGNGSWVPLLTLAAVLKVVGGLWLAKEMSTVDGRKQLAARDEAKKKK
eukprot:COSAG05_NODE_296_length_11959_cov_17.897639_8_plen_433_part_00